MFRRADRADVFDRLQQAQAAGLIIAGVVVVRWSQGTMLFDDHDDLGRMAAPR
jgi:hypothetical protein